MNVSMARGHARRLLCLLVVGMSLLGTGFCRAAEQLPWPQKPNIIFILADDLGYGDLGCYGQKRVRTPNLDKMAKEGLRYTSFYSGSTVCAPSRCSLMTGMHMGNARIRGNGGGPLKAEDRTVAEVLKGAGYSTAMIGKWGLGGATTTGAPDRKGFDEYFGYLGQVHAHDSTPDWLWNNGKKETLTSGTYSNDLFTSLSLDYIRAHKDKPFFLYLTYTIPHANNELGKETGNGMEVPSDVPYSGEKWPQVEKNFAAMITRMDGDIGRVMALVDDLGLGGKTVVFFTSDNGPHKEGGHDPDYFSSRGPLRGIKRDLYDGGIRVPMIVKPAGPLAAGTVIDEPYAFWDFLPTAAVLAGVQSPAGIDGIAMLPAGGEAKPPRHDYLYWEFFERGFQQAVRVGNWKAVSLKQGAPLELYDIAKDPGEQNNVAAAQPDVVKRCQTILRTARTDVPEWPTTPVDKGTSKSKAKPEEE
jgi:arylsulfatase A-like enzyme